MPDIKFDLSRGALLFDCDGTITDEDFLPYVVGQTIKDLVESRGHKFCQETFNAVFKANKGGGFDKYYNGYLLHKNLEDIKNHISDAEFSEQATDRYLSLADSIANGEYVGVAFNVNKDAIAIIKWANENKIPVAIVTNANPRILNANLKAAGIGVAGETAGQIFVNLTVHRGMYGGDAAQLRKPHPFPFQEACRLLGVDPEHSIGFEDSANGHESLYWAKIGLRVHVCKEHPSEAVHFVKGGLRFRPDSTTPHGLLTPEYLLELIEEKNKNGKAHTLAPNFRETVFPIGNPPAPPIEAQAFRK